MMGPERRAAAFLYEASVPGGGVGMQAGEGRRAERTLSENRPGPRSPCCGSVSGQLGGSSNRASELPGERMMGDAGCLL